MLLHNKKDQVKWTEKEGGREWGRRVTMRSNSSRELGEKGGKMCWGIVLIEDRGSAPLRVWDLLTVCGAGISWAVWPGTAFFLL